MAEPVTLAWLELDADMLTAWLGRFRDAARRLDWLRGSGDGTDDGTVLGAAG